MADEVAVELKQVEDMAGEWKQGRELSRRRDESAIEHNLKIADLEGKRQSLYARDVENHIKTRAENLEIYRAQLMEHRRSNDANERIASALESILARMSQVASES